MKQLLLVLSFVTCFLVSAQELTLKKGIVIDSLVVNDSLSETFAVYLPKRFEVSKLWPIVFVFEMEGKGRQAIGMLREAAEEEGYVLAASNNLSDTLSITNNVLITGRLIKKVAELLPIDANRVYTAGFSNVARMASLIPTFIRKIEGVISCGASITNIEVLNMKNPFHFVGIVGMSDYNYPEMLSVAKTLNKMKLPNQLLIFDGVAEWPATQYLSQALEIFTMSAMTKKNILKDSAYIEQLYRQNLDMVRKLVATQKPLRANFLLEEMMDVYRPHLATDSLQDLNKSLKKDKLYRSQVRSQNSAFFKEALIKEDYSYYLEEDVLTYNYNNLGWWNHQMEELSKYGKSANIFEQQMGMRLRGYINALIEDNIDLLIAETPIDVEAVNLLYMLKTITEPLAYDYYLKVISGSAAIDDYGTALFYLEELLKNGYTDKGALYALENTALLRITPEFNAIVEKYLKEARYDVIEE
ncbi:MAG: alpha/beta hydrolase [Flavobacteriales bacterium]|nr:MAG: alpha/beta hydrolase [Flavobacteriales bacterium]